MKDKLSPLPVESKPKPINNPNVRNSRLDNFMALLSRFEGCGFRRTLKGSRIDNLTPIKLHLTTIDHVLDSLEQQNPVSNPNQNDQPKTIQTSSSNSSAGNFENSRILLNWWFSIEERLNGSIPKMESLIKRLYPKAESKYHIGITDGQLTGCWSLYASLLSLSNVQLLQCPSPVFPD